MKRLLAALSAATLIAALVPGVATAARPLKFDVNHIGVGCFSVDEDVIADAFLDRDAEFGDFAFIDIWLDGALPDEDPPSLTGSTESIELVEGDDITFSATIPVTDSEGNPAGEVQIVATVAPDGEPFLDTGFDGGNINSHTLVVIQPLAGSGTLTLPDETQVALDCGGEMANGQVFETSPNAFTSNDAGVAFGCDWPIDGGFAFVFGSNSTFGTFLGAGFFDLDSDAFGEAVSPVIDAGGVSATFDLVDFISGDSYTADIDATFTPNGEPVTSVIIEANVREKVVEQDLSVDGTFEITPGDTFVMDDEHCDAGAFDSHRNVSFPQGPKGGKAPANDTPDGAIALAPGSKLNAQTTGTAPDAEVPNLLCDEGEIDLMGHTVWYTVEGTGGELTADTAGSNFDTIIAVYVEEGGELVEIACVDDVFGDPAGISLQAAITGPTEEGVTYWVQIGGWGAFFDEGQAGRLRLEIR